MTRSQTETEQEHWALVSSDPDVFTDMIHEYGVKDTKVEELWAIDFSNLEDEGPVYGFILVSGYVEEPLPKEWENEDPDEDNIIFTSQVVTNACGTLALMNVLLNSEVEVKGDILDNFSNFTKGFSSINRGLCLGNSTKLRNIHNAYLPATQRLENIVANQTTTGKVENDDAYTEEYEKSYHYVAYIYKNGFIWELDGLKNRPHKLTACNKNEWLITCEPLIQTRIQNLQDADEVDFSLLTVRHDNYNKMTTDNSILKSNIDLLNLICTNNNNNNDNDILLRRYEENLLTESNGFPLLKETWNEIKSGNIELAKSHLKEICEEQEKLEHNVKNLQEAKYIVDENIKKQKFDYFPFIETVITKALKKRLLQEPEEELEEPKKKRRRKSTVKDEKPATKRKPRVK